MTRRRTILLAVLLILAAAMFAGTRAAAPLARPALGFVAKVVCSDVFVGGFPPDRALRDLPDEPVARLVRTRVDTAARRVTASVPLIAARRATYRAGAGCTLEPRDAALAPVNIPSAPSRAPWPTPDTMRIAAVADTAVLRRALDDAFAEPDAYGPRGTRAVVIVHDGRIIAERYAAGFDSTSRFNGWSMTKSVTAALAGVLVGEKRIGIEQRALLPEWRGSDDPRRNISLNDLLQMSSGLDFDESYTPTGGATRMLFDSDDVAAVAAASGLAHEPGTHFHYSSATTNIISSIVRRVIGSDEAYHALPRRVLFDRIGMHSAVIEPDASGTLVGSSFMYATARDWARFGLLFLNDGVWNGERVLPDGWVAYSTHPAYAAPRGEYGAHWWLNAGTPADTVNRPWPRLPRDVYAASGFQGQTVMVVPRSRLVIVRLGLTADDRAWSIEDFAADIIAAVSPAPEAAPGR